MAQSAADFSNHMFVATSVILGLGLTEVLSGTGSWLRNRERIAISVPLALWVLLVFLTIVQAWWAVGEYVDVAPDFWLYALRIATDTMYFLLARMVLPNFSSPDVAKYFERNEQGDYTYSPPRGGERPRSTPAPPVRFGRFLRKRVSPRFCIRARMLARRILGRQAPGSPPSYPLRRYYWRNITTLVVIAILVLTFTTIHEYQYRKLCNAVGWWEQFTSKLGYRCAFGFILAVVGVTGWRQKRRVPDKWGLEMFHAGFALLFAVALIVFIGKFSLEQGSNSLGKCVIPTVSNTFWEMETQAVRAEPAAGGWRVTLDVRARKVVVDTVAVETEVPMNAPVEIGIYGAAEVGEPGEPLYLRMHRVRSGEQRITVTVPRRPARAGIDPRGLLIDDEPGDNVASVTRPGALPPR